MEKRRTATVRPAEQAAMVDRGGNDEPLPAGHMWVRMLTGIAGRRFDYAPGDIAHFPKPQAEKLIEQGYAVSTR